MMDAAIIVGLLASSLSFLAYGLACFYSKHLIAEFERYGVGPLRKGIGALEILGALGQLAGLYFDSLLFVSSGCLALLMLCAIVVRIRIHDPFVAAIPALLLAAINVYLALSTL